MTENNEGSVCNKEVNEALSRLAIASALTQDATLNIIELALEIRGVMRHFPDNADRNKADIFLSQIIEKCAFEDLASQHISKVVMFLTKIMGEIPEIIVKGDAEPSLLNGPKINAEDGLSQDAINALLGETNEGVSISVSSSIASTVDQVTMLRKNMQARKTRKKLEILIVDDQPFSAKLLDAMLSENYKTYLASSAQEAFEIYVNHAPNIMFLDIEMEGASGHELAETIKPLDKEAFIVMVTSNSYKEDIAAAKKNGTVGFIVKPFSKEKIFTYIDKYKKNR